MTKILNTQFKVIIAFLVGLIITSTNAYAFTDENNISVNVTSDKESYLKGENVSLNIDVLNNSQEDINDVNIKCTAPNEVTLLNSEVNLGSIGVDRHSNAVISLIRYQDENKEDVDSPATIEPGNSNSNESNTADGYSVIYYALILIFAGIAAIVFRKNKKVLSCMVIGIMFCTVINGTNANAAEVIKTINLDKTILVEGKEITVSFEVTYKTNKDNSVEADQEKPDNPATITPDKETEDKSGKTLVVYFSATNNTKDVANVIAESMEADIFELIPVVPYNDGDLDWTDDNSRVVKEHNDIDSRNVELTNSAVDNWESYDTVFIGYPIWWGIAAWPVDGFVKSNDFTGKTVIPFCTSASSGIGESDKLLQDMAGTGNWLEGRRFRSSVSTEDVQTWVESLKQ